MLIDRLARDDPQPPNGHIASHSWSAALYLLGLGEVTRAQVVNTFALSADDQIQLDAIIAFYGTLTTAQKAQWHNRVEASGILLEKEHISRAKYRSLLGFS